MNKPVRVKIDEMGATASGLVQECASFLPSSSAVADVLSQSFEFEEIRQEKRSNEDSDLVNDLEKHSS